MTDYKQLCTELVDSIKLLLEMRPVKARPLKITEERLHRARAALAEPEPEGPTDEELSDLWSWSASQDQGPWPTQQHCFARAVLDRWGNHPGSPDSSTLQPVLEPVAWMYQGEPSFDGTDWQKTWEVTTDKRLAEFKATPDQPIPLFSIPPQRQ